MIAIGNIFYFIPIILLVIITVLLVFLMRNKSKDFVDKFIFIMLLVNAALHFLKIFLPTKDYFFDLPYSFARISFENICAVSVILFPILYLFKNKYLNDAIVVIGVFSAIAAYAVPGGLAERSLTNPADFVEVFRYYLCHAPLLIAPVLMLTKKLHKLSYRRFFVVGGLFMVNLTVVFLNALLMKGTGVLPCTWEQFFSRNYANPGLIFGPNTHMYEGGMKYLDYLIPPFFKYTTSSGDIGFIPVLWYLGPVIALCLVVTLIFMIIEHHEVKKDYYYLCGKIRLKWLSRK